MKAGKLSAKQLSSLVLDKIGTKRSDVLIHASIGEDSAVIDFGDEVCIVSTDPITGATEGIGELAVHVSCNDIAANGGHPVGLQVLLLLPEHTNEDTIADIMREVDRTATTLGVEVIGGHTEVTSKVSDVIVAVTAIGRAAKCAYVSSAGAQPGDGLIMTKGAGIEGTLVLIQDFPERIGDLASGERENLKSQLSVVREGLVAASYGVSAMHDMTEGGLLGAACELATASQVGFEIWEEAVHVQPLTRRVCQTLNLDPLRLLASGSMLITSNNPAGLREHLEKQGITAFHVGVVTEQKERVLVLANGSKTTLPLYVEDELWRFYQDGDPQA